MKVILILSLLLGVISSQECDNLKESDFSNMSSFCGNAVSVLDKGKNCSEQCLKCGQVYKWEAFDEMMRPTIDLGKVTANDAEFYMLFENIAMSVMNRTHGRKSRDATVVFNIPKAELESGAWNITGRLDMNEEWIDLREGETKYTAHLFGQVKNVMNEDAEVKKFRDAYETEKNFYDAIKYYLVDSGACENEVGRMTLSFTSKPNDTISNEGNTKDNGTFHTFTGEFFTEAEVDSGIYSESKLVTDSGFDHGDRSETQERPDLWPVSGEESSQTAVKSSMKIMMATLIFAFIFL